MLFCHQRNGTHGGTLRRALVWTAVTTTAAMFTLPVIAAEIELGQLDSSMVSWKELTFRAKKLTFSAETTVALEKVSAAAAAADFVTPSRGEGVEPETDSVMLVHMTTTAMGRNSKIRLWVDPHQAAAYQRDQVDSGKSNRYRAYRFATEGVDRLTRRPAKGEASRPHSQWSEVDEHFEAYPRWAGSDLIVSEPTALFYIVSAANLQQPGDRVQVPTFSKNNLLLVEFTVRGKEKVKVDYVERSAGGEKRVKRTIEALQVLVDARHLDPDSDESQMEFMGLQGDIVMLFDPVTRVPLEVSGKVRIAGTVKVKLQQAVLK